MVEKRKIKDLLKGDKIKVHGRVAVVKSAVVCFKRSNDVWSFDVQLSGSSSACSLEFGDGDEEVELKEASTFDPIHDELSEMTKLAPGSKRRKKRAT